MADKLWRQGDILIQATTPQDLDKIARKKRLILAEGEATGHKHEVVPRHAARLYVPRKRGSGYPQPGHYLEVLRAGATVVHPEHRPIPLDVGWYRVWHQREFSGQVVD